MNIKITQISDTSKINNSFLKNRAEQSKSDFSIQFLALLNNNEVGFLSFDNKSHIGVGVIYEIYVLKEYRQTGIGDKLLEFGERLGTEHKCKKLVVCPRPLDDAISESFLVSWYKKHGYKWLSAGIDEMEKNICR